MASYIVVAVPSLACSGQSRNPHICSSRHTLFDMEDRVGDRGVGRGASTRAVMHQRNTCPIRQGIRWAVPRDRPASLIHRAVRSVFAQPARERARHVRLRRTPPRPPPSPIHSSPIAHHGIGCAHPIRASRRGVVELRARLQAVLSNPQFSLCWTRHDAPGWYVRARLTRREVYPPRGAIGVQGRRVPGRVWLVC